MTTIDRLKGQLYVALHCIYLENGDDVILSLGACRLNPGPFALTKQERFGVFVLGYNTQGYAEDKPIRQPEWTDEQFLELEHEAAFVRLSWILSHLIHADGKFSEAVKLVHRAADTMSRVASMIRKAASDLAEGLEMVDLAEGLGEADLAEEVPIIPSPPLVMEMARARYVGEDDASFPLLPCNFVTYMRNRAVAPKSSQRLAFEAEVLEVFSYGVCPAKNVWDLKDELSVSFTCKRKFYDEMSAEERAASGSVELKRIVADLVGGRTQDAVRASLSASRALEELARRLHRAACAAV